MQTTCDGDEDAIGRVVVHSNENVTPKTHPHFQPSTGFSRNAGAKLEYNSIPSVCLCCMFVCAFVCSMLNQTKPTNHVEESRTLLHMNYATIWVCVHNSNRYEPSVVVVRLKTILPPTNTLLSNITNQQTAAQNDRPIPVVGLLGSSPWAALCMYLCVRLQFIVHGNVCPNILYLE